LAGDDGDSLLNGAAGSDSLTGNGGRDTFLYNSTSDVLSGVDTIGDFNVAAPAAGGDLLDISDLLSGFAGASLADAIAGRFVNLRDDGAGNTLVEVDFDGSGDAFHAVATLVGVAPRTAFTDLADNFTLS
jgi:Ca2+-binding RTX toxin-like protein